MSKILNIEAVGGNSHHDFRELCLDNCNGVITIGVYSDRDGRCIDLTKDQVLQVINTLQEMINDECKENE